jgi:hypothetical protein
MSILDDRQQAQHQETEHKVMKLSLQIIGELSTMFVREWDCSVHFGRQFEHRCISEKFMPRLLSNDQKARRLSVCRELKQQTRDDPNFISNVITGDEPWVYGYEPETKQQSSQWKSPNSPQPKKKKHVKFATKSSPY